MKAYVASLIVLGLQMSPLPAADKKESPKPLPPEIVKAWSDAGASVGWMKWEDNGAPKGPKFHAQEKGEIKAMPVFQFSDWKEGVLVKLPDPGVPFGLSLNLTKKTDAGVTDAGLKELAGLKSLQELDLDFTKVTDAGLIELASLESLQALCLFHTEVTGAGLKELAGLKNLQELYLAYSQVKDTGLKELTRFKSLQTLDIRNNNKKVTDAALKEVAGLKSLQRLYLNHTEVTDKGLKELAVLKNLQTLTMWGTKATAAGVAALRKDLPKCNIADQ
jgi:internalin A